MSRVEISLPPLAFHVRTARLVGVAAARRAGVGEEHLDEVRLALGEACGRAVALHRAHAPAEPVVVRLDDSLDEGRTLLVQVLDRGPPGAEVDAVDDEPTDAEQLVDADQAARPDSDPGRVLPHGIGLAVVAGLVDDVVVLERPDGGTEVRLSWPRTAPPAPVDEPDHEDVPAA